MCGIVGLFFKDAGLETSLGALFAPMLVSLSDRGPDSTGFAVYGAKIPAQTKLTLRGRAETDFDALAARLGEAVGADVAVTRRDTHAAIAVASDKAVRLASELE